LTVDSQFRVRGHILAAMRSTYSPCLPTSGKVVPATSHWLHEVKHDGYRLIVVRDGDRVRLITRAAAVAGPTALLGSWRRIQAVRHRWRGGSSSTIVPKNQIF